MHPTVTVTTDVEPRTDRPNRHDVNPDGAHVTVIPAERKN